MKDFSFKIPQEIVFGLGSLKKLPGILKDNHIDNALLISDHGLESIGVVKRSQTFWTRAACSTPPIWT